METQKRGRQKKVDEITEIKKSVADLTELVMMVADNVAKKEESKGLLTDNSVSLPPVIDSTDIKKSVPSVWRNKINEILGTQFEAEVNESSGGNYLLKVYMPTDLDRRKGEEKNKNTKDCSVGLIRRATDVADVEKWLNLIKSNIKKFYRNFNN